MWRSWLFRLPHILGCKMTFRESAHANACLSHFRGGVRVPGGRTCVRIAPVKTPDPPPTSKLNLMYLGLNIVSFTQACDIQSLPLALRRLYVSLNYSRSRLHADFSIVSTSSGRSIVHWWNILLYHRSMVIVCWLADRVDSTCLFAE
jgi:hypothetical protein